jgi:hypothetical protein
VKKSLPAARDPILSSRLSLVLFAAALLLIIAACDWSLTRYYFAQDDFIFLERAGSGLRDSMAPFFNLHPGHFRPLTKGLYFLLMWPVFGLHPFPYHIASLLLHAIDSMLVGVVLRRAGISTRVSCAAALLFAVHLENFEAVAWVSCVQQLMGAVFTFAALILGIDALSGRGRTSVIAATSAYLVALCCYEQSVGVPLVLAAWQWSRSGGRAALRAGWGTLRGMLILMLVYCAYVFLFRGMPQDGPYVMSVGHNVLDNLRYYSGSVFSFWMTLPEFGLPGGFTFSHALWLTLIAWLVLRRKVRELAFGCMTFLILLAPVLFTHGHIEMFHLYIPLVGAWYVMASAVEAVREMTVVAWRRRLDVAVAGLVMVAVAGSFAATARNVRAQIRPDIAIPRNFVLRRAVLAERVCHDVTERWPGAARLVLIYAGDPRAANWVNIQSALGEGSALRLVLQRPGLDVRFVLPAEAGSYHEGDDAVMVVTDLGQTYTLAEWQEIVRRRRAAAGPAK